MVLIEDPWLLWWLRTLRICFKPHDHSKLFPFQGSRFKARIASLLSAAKVEAKSFTAAGLRAGGTTHMLRMGVSVEWLRHRGRWRQSATMERYLQECAAVLAERKMTSESRAHLLRLGHNASLVLQAAAEVLQARAARGMLAPAFFAPASRRSASAPTATSCTRGRAGGLP